jgi:hypothetical protein
MAVAAGGSASGGCNAGRRGVDTRPTGGSPTAGMHAYFQTNNNGEEAEATKVGGVSQCQHTTTVRAAATCAAGGRAKRLRTHRRRAASARKCRTPPTVHTTRTGSLGGTGSAAEAVVHERCLLHLRAYLAHRLTFRFGCISVRLFSMTSERKCVKLAW